MGSDKNGGIYLPLHLACGLCSEDKKIMVPLGHGVLFEHPWSKRGEPTGDLLIPKVQHLELHGWKVDFRAEVPTVTCPACQADRDNEAALKGKNG